MPQAIPIIIEAVGSYLGANAVVLAVVEIAAAVAVGYYEQDRARAKARDAYNASLQDRLQIIRSGVVARRYILGTARAAGALVYADSIGPNKIAFDSVVAVAGNVVEATGYYIGDEFISIQDFPGLKYGHREIHDAVETFVVSGPTAVVTLSQTPAPDNYVFPLPGGDSGPVSVNGVFVRGADSSGLAASFGTNNQLTITGLPNASDIEITVYYKVFSGDKLRVQFKSGLATQSSTSWGDYISSMWDDGTHNLKGVANMRVLNVWDENVYPSGAPPFGVVGKGGPVDGYPIYDPRTNTNPSYTSNPAILWGYWRTLPRKLGGMGVPAEWIDWQSVAVAANICDELIVVRTLGGNAQYELIKRYECHTVLSTDNTPAENERIILSAMAGKRAFTAGLFKVVAGAFRPASIVLTDADIVGTKPLTVITADPSVIPPNIVTARFADSAKNWVESEPLPVKNDAYILADGHEQPWDINLPATTDGRQANYLMGVELESRRPAFSVSLSIGPVGENLALFDTVQLNLTNRSAYAGRTFEVLGLSDNWDGTFDATFAEIKSTTYALDPDRFTPVAPAATPDLSYLWNIPPLSNFRATPQTPVVLPDGTSISRVLLSWDPPPGDYISQGGHIETRYRQAGGEWISNAPVPGDATSTTITAAIVDFDAYQFQGRAVSAIGAAGPWADSWQQITNSIPIQGTPAIRLRADSLFFHVPASGSGTITPAVITLTVDRQGGLTQPIVWTTSPSATLNGTGDSRTLAYAAMPGSSVQITAQITQSNVLYTDTLTIVKLLDGADAPDYIPDLTPPPTPTGLTGSSALLHNFLVWDPPTYTQGHGPDSVVIYGVKVTGSPTSVTFANASPVGSEPNGGAVFSHQTGTAETWAYWIKHKTKDGVLSVSPAGGTNGLQLTVGKIGDVDLGPLIIEAGDLASGAVTADKIAAGVIDATKFATGIEPVPTVATLPSTKLTAAVYLSSDRNLYVWNGSSYVLPAAGVTTIPANTITTTMIQDGAISTPKLAANSVTANAIAAGQVTAGKLAANSVQAGNIAANAVTAGTIAANAVNAQAIAAGAITTSKLLVAGQGAALNDDPAGIDSSAWSATQNSGSVSFQANVDSSIAPGGKVLRVTASGDHGGVGSRTFPIIPGKRYRVSLWARQVSGSGVFYLRLWEEDIAGNVIAYIIGIEGITITGSFARYSGVIDTAANAVRASIRCWPSYVGTGVVDLADIRCEEVIPGELIVDGAITASKISANAIAVGTAAIQNGAIVNAMIGSLAVDDSKIANLDAAKITAGVINAARIATGSLSGDKITANTLDAIRLIAGTITADRIQANSIDAGQIKFGGIPTDRIAAGAISTFGVQVTGAVGPGQQPVCSLILSVAGGQILIQGFTRGTISGSSAIGFATPLTAIRLNGSELIRAYIQQPAGLASAPYGITLFYSFSSLSAGTYTFDLYQDGEGAYAPQTPAQSILQVLEMKR